MGQQLSFSNLLCLQRERTFVSTATHCICHQYEEYSSVNWTDHEGWHRCDRLAILLFVVLRFNLNGCRVNAYCQL